MASYLPGWLINLSVWLMICTGASAATVAQVDSIVNDCVYGAGVTGTYNVTPVRYGQIAAYSVPQGAGVSAAQSARINACISATLQGANSAPARVQPVRVQPAQPTDKAGCLAEYQAKLRATNGGQTYRGSNLGTRLVSGLFGRGMGRNLIENEYDRCLDHFAYLENRCPNGLFTGGAGYCIRRPYR